MNTQNLTSPALQEQERLQRVTQNSDLIFIGTIIDAGTPPNEWSGYFSSYQTVRYKVQQILKGKNEATEISVDHVVVHGSKTAEPGETPKLATGIFYPGASLIVSAVRSDADHCKSLNEVIGAVPNSADWLRRVEVLLPNANQ
jgi:hypothetical protein